jgi:hypothetical protein
MDRHKIKYCPQALAMIATIKRQGKRWNTGGQGAAVHKHLERCMKCGRDLTGTEWPPR